MKTLTSQNDQIVEYKGWYTRGYLPHYDTPYRLQFITYRLADSLPKKLLDSLEVELLHLPEDQRDPHRKKRIEEWLDSGIGCCALAHPAVASYVQNAWFHFHGERYRLHAWCIMPNHVHVLIEPLTNLATIVHGWKSFTARWALRNNTKLRLRIPSSNLFWMRDYWDRFIRDANHYGRVVQYIHENPVSAGLCSSADQWLWSSAGTVGGSS